MELEDLERRLKLFCEDRYQSAVEIDELAIMPGHAGFAYGSASQPNQSRSLGSLDFLRMSIGWALQMFCDKSKFKCADKTNVPHCSVKWSGTDLEWFDRPYFVVPLLEEMFSVWVTMIGVVLS